MRPAANLGPRRRAAVLGGLTVMAVVPWLLLPASPAVWLLLGLELALLVGYSVPPVRAKERGPLALVFDASYAYVVPIALTFAAFGQQDVGSVEDLTPLVVTSLAWAFATGLRGIASVFTIHNLRYRGPDEFNDFLSQAIYYSDMVTTVSPTYAREVMTEEFGEGLESLLNLRSNNFVGILNGLNTDLFNPRTDPFIAHQFDLTTIEERQLNRTALRSELALPDVGGPLAAMVTRLTEQKGVDLVIQALPVLVAADAQLVVLGDGDQSLKEDLARLELAHPGRVRLAPRFDENFAQRIYAGSDVFLMPSRYEPCGLGQLIAMRYGSVPVGRRTGGLTDSIFDLDEHPDSPTGFLFDEFSSPGFAGAFERAALAFRDPVTWRKLQVAGMSHDFSWNASAKHYVDIYIAALRSRGIVPLE